MTDRWLTLPTLGTFGRLGNQLWQIAMGISHAHDHGAELRMGLWEYSSDFPGLAAAGVTYHRTIAAAGMFAEPAWNFTRRPPFWNGMGLHGYWQSPRYWEDRELVRRALRPRPHLEVDPCTCVVHVRRGDYLQLPDHHVIPPRSWYDQAMVMARSAGADRFEICSDDPVWCAREWPEHEISQRTEVHDLALMAGAPMLIMAPSSLSWWGAYLGGNLRTVFAPRRWFGPALAPHDVTQLDPGEGWVWLE